MSNPGDFIIENGILKEYKGPGGNVVVPEGVTEIGSLAFWHGSAGKLITSIVVPHGVTRIGRSAFRGCAALRTIVFPESLSELGDSICADCSSLEGVHITSVQLPLVYRLAFGKMSFSLIVHDTQGCEFLAFASPKGSDLDNIR